MRRRSLVAGLGAIVTGAAIWRGCDEVSNRVDSLVSLRSVASVPAGGRQLAWSPDARRLGVSGANTAFIDTADWRVVTTFGRADSWRAPTLALLSNSEAVAGAPGSHGEWAWESYDIDTGKRLRQIPRPPGRELGEIRTVAVTGDRKFVALVKGPHAGVTIGKPYSPQVPLLFAAGTGDFLGRLAVPLDTAGLLATGPGSKLAVADWPAVIEPRKAIYLLDAATNTVDRPLAGHLAGVGGMAWSPDGRMIASATGGHVGAGERDALRIWNVISGEVMASFAGPIEQVRGVSWHPDGKVIATLGARGDGNSGSAVRLWSISDGRMIFEHFPGPFSTAASGTMSFHPVSGLLVWSLRDTLQIFEVRGIA